MSILICTRMHKRTFVHTPCGMQSHEAHVVGCIRDEDKKLTSKSTTSDFKYDNEGDFYCLSHASITSHASHFHQVTGIWWHEARNESLPSVFLLPFLLVWQDLHLLVECLTVQCLSGTLFSTLCVNAEQPADPKSQLGEISQLHFPELVGGSHYVLRSDEKDNSHHKPDNADWRRNVSSTQSQSWPHSSRCCAVTVPRREALCAEPWCCGSTITPPHTAVLSLHA